MSSPTVSNGPAIPLKRRRPSASADMTDTNPAQDNVSTPQSLSPGHIPKRGARACTSCRKGKNRCEGEPPCRRCQLSGTPCIFEKPERKNAQVLSGANTERLSRLEGQYLVMQSQMIGMQSSLDRILSAVQPHTNGGISQQSAFYPGPATTRDTSAYAPPQRTGFDVMAEGQPRRFLPSPGSLQPSIKHSTYGSDPITGTSSEDEAEDALPRSAANARIEALQGLADAAAEAAAAPSPRVKRRKIGESLPRSPFPHIVEKGLISDGEARELYHIFFAGCHLFIPLFDPSYDTYESLIQYSPWTFNAILAVAAKVKSGNGPPSSTFHKCLEEAQFVARASLFGPATQKEAVRGMLLLAGWSTSGWLSSGHAMRMALDLGLHRALDKLADGNEKQRTDEEERDLVVSARIWLCLYCFDHQISLGTGRPIVFRDDSSIRHCRQLLTHPMASPTDVRLVTQVELIAQKTQIYETLTTSNGHLNNKTLDYIRRANITLDNWWADADETHGESMDKDSLPRKILDSDLHYAKLWLVCLALRNVSRDELLSKQRELAFQAKDSALNCLSIFLTSSAYRAALRYPTHDGLVTAAFSGLFLLKFANLFPAEMDLGAVIAQTEQLIQLLFDISAERHALALRIMLTHLRRKTGVIGGMSNSVSNVSDGVANPSGQGSGFVDPVPAPFAPSSFTTEELRFTWPNGRGISGPSSIPPWLQEQNLEDLGLPENGIDGIFLQSTGVNGSMGDC